MKKVLALIICVSTRGNELLMQLLHSRKLCFYRDYDTTDLGLKLEYSDLNWEMIFLFKWIVYSVWIKAPHVCWYHFLFTSVIIRSNTSSKQEYIPPKISQVPENTENDIFLQDVQKYWPESQHMTWWNLSCLFHLYYTSAFS